MDNNQKLYEIVMRFMIDNKVRCEETIYQCDRVIINAYEFIDELYQVVKEDLPDFDND